MGSKQAQTALKPAEMEASGEPVKKQYQVSRELEKEILTKLSGQGLSVFYLCGWLRRERGIDVPLIPLKIMKERGLIDYDHDANGNLIFVLAKK